MSLTGRIEGLSRRHAELEEKIQDEQKRPAANDTTLKELKRQKLRIKQEMGSLQAN